MSGCSIRRTSIAQDPEASEHAWEYVCASSCSLPWVRPPFAVAKSMILIAISVYRILRRFPFPIPVPRCVIQREKRYGLEASTPYSRLEPRGSDGRLSFETLGGRESPSNPTALWV